MKNIDELLETGHGFIIFDSTELIEEGYNDEKELREPTTTDFTYSTKYVNRNALKYIAWQYMVDGVTAREILKANEMNLEFWDAVGWFIEAEIDFDDCYSVND